jgi:hypothetical protein
MTTQQRRRSIIGLAMPGGEDNRPAVLALPSWLAYAPPGEPPDAYQVWHATRDGLHLAASRTMGYAAVGRLNIHGARGGAASSITLAAPAITLSADEVFFDTTDPVPPAPAVVSVGNAGDLPLPDLSASVAYTSGATGWLTALLSSPAAPCTLTLTASIAGIYDGTHTATVTVASAQWAPPVALTVTLDVEASTVPLGTQTFARASSATYTVQDEG